MAITVTGFALRECIRRLELKRDVIVQEFSDSQMVFPGDDKRALLDISQDYENVELQIAKIQSAQARYNSLLRSDVTGMTLGGMIKAVGGLARLEKAWRVAAVPPKDRYGLSRDNERDPTKIQAKRNISIAQAAIKAQDMSRTCSKFREELSRLNGTSISVDDIGLDPSLFTS